MTVGRTNDAEVIATLFVVASEETWSQAKGSVRTFDSPPKAPGQSIYLHILPENHHVETIRDSGQPETHRVPQVQVHFFTANAAWASCCPRSAVGSFCQQDRPTRLIV
jgi:hypothetical protein